MKVVIYLLAVGKEAEQGYEVCASLTRCLEKHGKKELDTACTEGANYTAVPFIRLISMILKNGMPHLERLKPEPCDYTNAYGITRVAI